MKSLKIILLVFVLVVAATTGYSQKRPARTKKAAKSKVVFDEPLTTDPFTNKASLPEGNEAAWSYLTDGKASFKILFPGNAVKNMMVEEFNKKEFNAASYNLESERAAYNLTYFNLILPAKDAKDLTKLYDSFDKEILNRSNSGLRGVTTEIIDRKEFSSNGISGREITLKDIDGTQAVMRQIFAGGKFYYFSVSPSPNLPQLDKDAVKNAADKFFNSFELIQK